MPLDWIGPRLPYADRAEGGRVLAEILAQTVSLTRPVILALPRGGIPVAFEVSERLDAPLDVVLVRKLGVPGDEELAMGAISAGGMRVLNSDVVETLRIADDTIEAVAANEQRELERRGQTYLEGRPLMDVQGRQAILVDDGLATGATMRVAALAVHAQDPAQVIVASPVGAADVCAELDGAIDRVVCAAMPEPFYGVGRWYRDFGQTTDDEVRELLARAWGRIARS